MYTTWQLFHLETILESGRFMMKVEKGAMSYLFSARGCTKDQTDGTIKQNLNIFTNLFTNLKLSQHIYANTEDISGRV